MVVAEVVVKNGLVHQLSRLSKIEIKENFKVDSNQHVNVLLTLGVNNCMRSGTDRALGYPLGGLEVNRNGEIGSQKMKGETP